MPLLLLLFLTFGNLQASPIQDGAEKDGDASRKILGSSVVTSVSVIMDSGHGSQTYFADAAGKPVSKPQTSAQLASPINLLNPDRYEFFTFDDNGELIKRLMTLEEIQGIIANGDGEETENSYLPEKKVNDIVSNVQNVLKEEIESHKNNTHLSPMLDTPDVSSTWSMILPAIFGNSGEDINPDRTQPMATPETIMVENAKPATEDFDATKFETHAEEIKPVYINIPQTQTKKPDELDVPIITVEIITNKPEIEATKNIERVTLNKTKPTTQAPPTSYASTTKKQQLITTTEKITSEVKVNEQTTTTASGVVNGNLSNFEEIITSSSITAETTPQLLLMASTARPTPFTNAQTKPVVISPVPTKTPALSSLQGLSTSRPILFIENEEVTQTASFEPSAEESVTDELPDEIEPDTDNEFPQNESSVLSTTTPTSASISPSTSAETTPILLIVQEKVKGTTTIPETTTSGFLSTFFFIDDRNKNKHQTTHLPASSSEDIPTPSSSNLLVTVVTEEEPTPSPMKSTTLLRPTSFKEQVTTERVNTVQTTQHLPKETSKSPWIILDTQKPEQEVIKQVPTVDLILPVKNEQVTPNPPTINDQSTLLSILEEDTTSKRPSIYDLDLKPMEEDDATTPSKDLTTQNPITSSKQVVTEALGQFLLSSTNIYEINSQLADSSSSTVTPEDFTTEKSLISSIEQLISQAVGTDDNPVVLDADDSKKVEEVLDNTKDKFMEEAQAEIATAASVLLDKTANDESLQLSEAVGSLLSQVSDALPAINGTMESLLQMDFNSEVPVNNTSTDEQNILPDSTEKIPDVVSTDKTPAPEMVYEEIDIQKIMDEINLTQDINKEEEQTTTAKLDVTETVNIKMTEGSHLYGVNLTQDQNNTKEVKNTTAKIDETEITTVKMDDDSHSNKTRIAENATEKPITGAATTTTTSKPKDKLAEATKLGNDLTKEKIEDTGETEILEAHPTNPTRIQLRPENEVKLPATTEKASSVYDVVTSTAKYSTSSLLTPSANNVVKVVANNSPGNYKMETATEGLGALTTKRKVVSEQEEGKNSTWTLVPTVLPHSNVTFAPVAPKPAIDNLQPPMPVKLSPHPVQGFGLEDSTSRLDTDIYQFVELCNELAFGFWSAVTTGISSVRSIFVSPFAATSLLAMVFLGARGSTSGEMNEILKLDDMVTFNPHLIFKNVSESIEVSKTAGVAASVIARELYSDRSKGKLLSFYKERAKQFYDGHVEEVNFKEIGDIIRRRTNLLIKKYTWGKVQEYVKDGSITVRPPLAGVSASVFQTDCSSASTQGRDGELYFVVLPSVRQRRLIPVPSTVWRGGFLAGYDPGLDATAAAIGTQDQTVSVIFVIPGQQGISAPGDGLWRLEKRLVESSFKQGAWSRLLRSLIPRPGLELQIPRFSHKSVINATVALKNMGLKDLFSYDKADLKGLNGASHELHLSDILQINNFVMCGEVPIGDDHHVEIYPATAKRPSRRSRKLELRLFSDPDLGEEPRDYQRAFNDPLNDPDLLSLPLSMRPRQARIPDAPRLRFDRPFLFFVRHNPTGLILHMGRFNPRLLP